MTAPAPGLYIGDVIHTRMKPVRHRLKYSVFYLLLDVDNPAAGLRLLSHNRFNLFSFHDRDHGPGDGRPLRLWVETAMARAGLPAPRTIRLLTLPRVLGYVFNPISLYFCYDDSAALSAVIYEVNNTFGERHSYLARANGEDRLEHDCPKRFYVSPFNDMTGGYRMSLDAPGPRIDFAIHQKDSSGPLLFAGLTLARRPLKDRNLLRMFCGMPLMTLKVIAAIHWEAFKLWRKGMKPVPREAPPGPSVTVITDKF